MKESEFPPLYLPENIYPDSGILSDTDLFRDPQRGTDLGALISAITLAVLPILIAFLTASKFFMSGLTAGAVKE